MTVLPGQLELDFAAPAKPTGPVCRQCGHTKRNHCSPDARCLQCDQGGGKALLGDVCRAYVAPRQAAECMACGRRPPEAHVYVAHWRDAKLDKWFHGWLCVFTDGCQEFDPCRPGGTVKKSPVEWS